MKNERSFNKSSAINQSTKSDWDDAKTKVAEAKDSVLDAMNHSIADKKKKVAKKSSCCRAGNSDSDNDAQRKYFDRKQQKG